MGKRFEITYVNPHQPSQVVKEARFLTSRAFAPVLKLEVGESIERRYHSAGYKRIQRLDDDRLTAWDLIGFDGYMPYEPERSEKGPGWVRIIGGRALYEAVDYDDSRRGKSVRLGRLDTDDGLKPVIRYVDPDTPMEFVPDSDLRS